MSDFQWALAGFLAAAGIAGLNMTSVMVASYADRFDYSGRIDPFGGLSSFKPWALVTLLAALLAPASLLMAAILLGELAPVVLAGLLAVMVPAFLWWRHGTKRIRRQLQEER